MDRTKRGIVVGLFSLLVFVAVSAPAAYADIANGTYTLNIWNNNASDGQVLVIDDVIGMFGDFTPKFVRRYAEIGDRVTEAASAYAADVRARRFPGPENCFGAGPTALARAK